MIKTGVCVILSTMKSDNREAEISLFFVQVCSKFGLSSYVNTMVSELSLKNHIVALCLPSLFTTLYLYQYYTLGNSAGDFIILKHIIFIA